MTINSRRRIELARLISRLNRAGAFPEIRDSRPVGAAFRIGITGPVGAGKSTLINRLALEYRQHDFTVGIIAVDPSSPFTGGAVLGDRIRMTDLALDEGVFIRSLATRGVFGGLAENSVDAADLIDAFGFDRIILETVGVGQTEVDIVEACDVTVVILEPSSGDSIQALKAGLMEIADLFVVNKMDMRGAHRFVADIQSSLELRGEKSRPEVIPVQARTNEGIQELRARLENYYLRVQESGFLLERRTTQRLKRLKRVAGRALIRKIWDRIPPEELEKAANSAKPIRIAANELVEKYSSLLVK